MGHLPRRDLAFGQERSITANNLQSMFARL
jgi:hypothetical protein